MEMERRSKPRKRSVEKLFAARDDLISRADRSIADGNEVIERARHLLSRSSLTMLHMLLMEHKKALGNDGLYKVVSRNLKALQEEMAAGTPVDPAVIQKIETSIKHLASQYDAAQLSRRQSA